MPAGRGRAVFTGDMPEQHLAFISGPGSWPGPAGEEDESHGGGGVPAIAEITQVMGDTRRLASVAGALLAAGMAGAAIVVSALLRHGHAVAWTCAALLVPVVLGWLAAALMLVLTEQPAAIMLGELRRGTGAPADLSAPWRPVGVRPLSDADAQWERVVSLIGAATLAHARARRALTAAIVATAGFGLWAVLSLAIAAVL